LFSRFRVHVQPVHRLSSYKSLMGGEHASELYVIQDNCDTLH